MSKTLLEKALELTSPPSKSDVTQEQIDLALAYLQGKVTMTQVAKVLEMKGSSNASSKLLQFIREAHRMKQIIITADYNKVVDGRQ